MELFCPNYLITKNYKIIDTLIDSCSVFALSVVGSCHWGNLVLVGSDLSGSRAPKVEALVGFSGASDNGMMLFRGCRLLMG